MQIKVHLNLLKGNKTCFNNTLKYCKRNCNEVIFNYELKLSLSRKYVVIFFSVLQE